MRFTIKYMKCSNSRRRSCGPGLASGCPWKLKAGRSVRATPCSEPSNSERCVARKRRRAASPHRPRSHGSGSRSAPGPSRVSEHRMIGAVMAELHLHGLRAAREPEQLMPEANAEHRDVGLQKARDRRDGVVAGLGIARVRYLRKYHQDSSQVLDLPVFVPARRSCGNHARRGSAKCCA